MGANSAIISGASPETLLMRWTPKIRRGYQNPQTYRNIDSDVLLEVEMPLSWLK